MFVKLSYSPKDETLRRKFGDLPLKYIRTSVDTEEEFDLLEKAIKRYNFDISEEVALAMPIEKRKINIISSTIVKPAETQAAIEIQNDDEEETQPKAKRIKKTPRPTKDDKDLADKSPVFHYNDSDNDNILSQIW